MHRFAMTNKVSYYLADVKPILTSELKDKT